MSEDEVLKRFAEQVVSEINDRTVGVGGAPDFRENAFVRYVAEILEEAGAVEESTVTYFDRSSQRPVIKVNGFGFGDDRNELYLLACIFHDSEELVQVPKGKLASAMQQAANVYAFAKKSGHTQLEVASDEYAMVRDIYDALNTITRIRVFVITDGLSGTKTLDELNVGSLPITGEVWDVRRLSRCVGAGHGNEPIEIDFEVITGQPIHAVEMPESDDIYKSYLTIIPAAVLYEIYKEYGSRLLELNVRSFLQATGAVNKGIRDTLRTEPTRFLAYNNGISATVESLTPSRIGGALAIKSVSGLQIVNGGQTTASIYRAGSIDKADLSRVYVQAKITVVAASHLHEMVSNISRYANTQNTIQSADFSSNDPYQVELEKLSRNVWTPDQSGLWFFERARGQYQVEKSKATTPAQKRKFNELQPPGRKFSKTDVAKVEMCWEQRPHIASKGNQKNFLEFIQGLEKLEKSGWVPDQAYYKNLIAKLILFRSAESIIRKEKIPAYRANVAAYELAYLAHCGAIDLTAVWSRQAVSSALEQTMREWTHRISDCLVKTAGGRNVTEWCKKPECWTAVKQLSLSPPPVSS